ncbi:MAG: hypothetical protein ACK5NG_07645 [Chthoniobacterales bacterium]
MNVASFEPLEDIVILISTCEKRRHYAELTKKLIENLWEYHPLIYFSGASVNSENPGDAICLPLPQGSTSWAEINREALLTLKNSGFRQVYFILDDHPPMGECNPEFLNTILPNIARESDLKHVNLFGYGQGFSFKGKFFKKGILKLKQSSEEQSLRSTFYPGLWEIDTLIELFSRLSDKTPVNFAQAPPVSLIEETYYIHGSHLDKNPLAFFRHFVQYSFQVFYNIFFAVFARFVKSDKLQKNLSWIFHSYRGPYPVFQDGLLLNNQRNPHLMQHLAVWDDANLTYELEFLDWSLENPDALKNRLPTKKKKV